MDEMTPGKDKRGRNCSRRSTNFAQDGSEQLGKKAIILFVKPPKVLVSFRVRAGRGKVIFANQQVSWGWK